MATVIQSPDSLSLLGNLKSFKISSSSPVTFKLMLSGGRRTIIEEEYTPDANDVVEISVKGVIAQFLSISLPTTNVYSQDNAHDSFSAYVNNTLAGTFTVIDCGVRKISGTVENFLKANWLTWQPQTKLVRWNQPEYLTYYHTVASVVKAKFYTLNGQAETVTISSASAGTYKSYNVELAHLFSLSSYDADELNGVVDVWVQTTGGTRLSYIQRFVFTPDTRNEHYFLSTNSLGGIDTFCFTGARVLSPSIAHEVAEQSEIKLNISADPARAWTQNTGPFGPTEAKWIWEFFAAAAQWAIVDDNLESIVLDSSSISASDGENVNSCSFAFSLSEEGTLLKIVRDSGALPNIQVPSPTGEIFFLAPRVVDYPDANLSDTLLFLTQSPFVQEWKKLSLGDLTDYVADSIRETAWGQLAHSHSNKDVIDLFSVDAETGKLLFDGEPVIAEGGDYESLTNLPTINGTVIKGDKLASDYGLVGPDMFELDTTSVPGKVFIKAKYDGLYTVGSLACGGPGDSGTGGSTVIWNQIQESIGATKIATIEIDGVSQDVYAPSGGVGTLAALSDVSLNDPSGYNVLYYNNSAWRNIPFNSLVTQWGLLSSSSEAMITGDWYFTENNPLQFVNNLGYIQIYGRRSGTQYSLNLYANYAINLMTGTGGKIYANGVEITGGGGGGSTVSWGTESGDGVPLTVNGTTKTLALSSSIVNVSWGTESGGGVPLTIGAIQKTLALASALSSYLPLSGGTMTGDILPNSTSVKLGSSTEVWGEIHANKWYPNASDTTHYIEYTTNGFVIHGNVAANGNVAAGA